MSRLRQHLDNDPSIVLYDVDPSEISELLNCTGDNGIDNHPRMFCNDCNECTVILSNHTSLIQCFYWWFVGLQNTLIINPATLNERTELKKKRMQCLLQNMLILLCEERS